MNMNALCSLTAHASRATRFRSAGLALLLTACAAAPHAPERTLGSVSARTTSVRNVHQTSARTNTWTEDAVLGPTTSLTRRPDGSWAGTCNGGVLEVHPSADGALDGVQNRSGLAAPVHLVVGLPEGTSQNVVEVEGDVRQPQLTLAYRCLF
jgi:hypothetical protein